MLGIFLNKLPQNQIEIMQPKIKIQNNNENKYP